MLEKFSSCFGFLAALGLSLSCSFIVWPAPATGTRPNFLIILADDMGFSDAGCYGGKFSEGWTLVGGGDMEITTKVGAYVEHTFTGSGIRWIGGKFDDAGTCEVSIDGKVLTKVDQYDPGRDKPFRYGVRDLAAGRHTIRLTLLEEKNPASRDRYANVTGFDVASPTGNSPEPLPGPRTH
jgi:hypothetical protein